MPRRGKLHLPVSKGRGGMAVGVDPLLAAQGVRLAPLGPEWPRLRQLCIDERFKGSALPDAWLAAATSHLGEHLVSFDRDFRKSIGRSQFTLLEANAR